MFQKLKHRFSKEIDRLIHEEITLKLYSFLSLKEKEQGVSPQKEGENAIIVSLTTYGKRIYDVHLAIESILQQTDKPTKILLWLAEDEFADTEIPLLLKKQQARGLEIYFCEDIRSYKKIIPTIKAYPSAVIVTIDDDTIYPTNFLEKLLLAYKKNPRAIYFYRGKEISIKNNQLMPYRKWPLAKNEGLTSLKFMPTGVGGVLYPPGCFFEDVTNASIFMDLCPNADDIWLKAMSLLNNYPCSLIDTTNNFNNSFVTIPNSQNNALWKKNLDNNENDKQLQLVFNKYCLIEKLQL